MTTPKQESTGPSQPSKKSVQNISTPEIKEEQQAKQHTLSKNFILLKFFSKEKINMSDIKNTSDTQLECMLIHAMKDDEFIPKAAKYLQPLVPRIMQLSDWGKDKIFQGSATIGVGKGLLIHQDNSDINDRYLNQGEFGLARLIHKIKINAQSLDKKSDSKAYQAVITLHHKLSAHYLKYLLSPNKNHTFSAFKSNCNQAIFEAQEILENHPSWENVFANVLLHFALLITTAGVGNIIAAGCAYYSSAPGRKSLLFFLASTDSEKCIKNIEQSMDRLNHFNPQ